MQRVSGFASGFGACLLGSSKMLFMGLPETPPASRAEVPIRKWLEEISILEQSLELNWKGMEPKSEKGVVALQTANWEVVELIIAD
jgi:hypothetical protein